MDSIPLFMKSLPDPSSSAEENPALEALRSLVYEGNPEGMVSSPFPSFFNIHLLFPLYPEKISFSDHVVIPAEQR
jgi:hypothetical protein